MKNTIIIFFCLCLNFGYAQENADFKDRLVKTASIEKKYVGEKCNKLLNDLNDYIKAYKVNITDTHAFIILYFDDQETYFDKRAQDKTPSMVTIYFDSRDLAAYKGFEGLKNKDIQNYSKDYLKEFQNLRILGIDVFVEK